MKKFTTFCVFFALFSLQYIIGQTIPSGFDAQENLNVIGDIGTSKANLVARVYDTRYQGVKGTPYLYEDWRLGDIIFTDSLLAKNELFKLDLYNNELILFKDKKDSFLLDKSKVLMFVLQSNEPNQYFFFKKMNVNEETYKSNFKYLQVLFDKKIKLYALRGKELLKADYIGAYSANRPYDELLDEDFFYIQKPNESILTKLRLNKKNLMKFVDNYKNEMEEYTKKHNLDLKIEAHAIQFLEYFNLLISK